MIHIGCLIRDLPGDTIISLGGVGRAQLAVNSLAVSIGYGVRIGLEDNLWFDKNRTRLASNIELLERIHNVAMANGREFMSPAELRNLLNLNKR